ncbi:hypothetical protein PP182_08055 [Maribacter sp. PR1]|uniref:DUF4126 domain-containing protein n=1 Tax=Maribacter cobaltidurans TaxID=1178778 RepID=A0ABU7ISS3_9FLAO|nr:MULTISPECIES: hypothetical protein [Maribacter]MDC6388633.1 hypothetical protein [Maribacter sp. PR1]MEE1976022.1 hypothetical protein [Maribacter cobaltidurans]
MRTLLLLSLLIFLALKGQSQVSEDKVLHFVGGNLFGMVGAGLANQISDGNRAWTFAGSVGGSLLIGLAKEGIDQNQYGGWDNEDLLATVLGGVTVGVTIDIFKQKKKRKREQLFRDAIGFKIDGYTHPTDTISADTSLSILAISPNVLNRNR